MHIAPRAVGFTIIEFIIYIAIASIVLIAVIHLNIRLTDQFARSKTRSQIQRDFHLVFERMKQEIHAAFDINTGTSTFDAHPGALTLIMKDPLTNPTVFSLRLPENILTMTQGGAPAVQLTSDGLTVDTLIFHNLSNPSDSSRNVQFALGLKYTSPDGGVETMFAATTTVELMDR